MEEIKFTDQDTIYTVVWYTYGFMALVLTPAARKANKRPSKHFWFDELGEAAQEIKALYEANNPVYIYPEQFEKLERGKL